MNFYCRVDDKREFFILLQHQKKKKKKEEQAQLRLRKIKIEIKKDCFSAAKH